MVPEKMPERIILGRLEVILLLIQQIGLNPKSWTWQSICDKMVIPSTSSQFSDVRFMAAEILGTLF